MAVGWEVHWIWLYVCWSRAGQRSLGPRGVEAQSTLWTAPRKLSGWDMKSGVVSEPSVAARMMRGRFSGSSWRWVAVAGPAGASLEGKAGAAAAATAAAARLAPRSGSGLGFLGGSAVDG